MAPFGMFSGPDDMAKTRAQRQQRELDYEEQERERRLALKEEYRARGIDLDAPLEDLACPRCRKHYEYGTECPDCNVYLVGSSALDNATPQESYRERSWPLPIRVATMAVVILGVLGFSVYLLAQFL